MTDRKSTKGNKGERAMALLALARHQQDGVGRCLTAGELAGLVDGRYGEPEKGRLLHHLAGCENCYGEWLLLQDASGQPAKKGRLVHLPRVRRYGAIGSALALAASVVVFLNIVRQPSDLKVEPPVQVEQGQSAGQAVPGPPPVATMPDQRDQLIEKRREMVVEESAAKARPENRQDQEASSEVTIRGPAPGIAAKGAAPPAEPIGRRPTTVTAWWQQLGENCRADTRDLGFWVGLRDEGQRLLAAEAKTLGKGERVRLARALFLLEAMEDEAVSERCRLLLDLLAQPAGSG